MINQYNPCVLVRLSSAVRRHQDQASQTLIKDNTSLGLAFGFRGSVHFHGSVQAGAVYKELRVLHPDPKAAGDCLPQAARKRLAKSTLGKA